MIIEKTKNQHGEEVTCHEIYLTDKQLWVENTLSCLSSRSMDMGTCLCVNHSTWESRIIPREEVKEIISKNVINLSDEEKEYLLNPSFEIRVRESFALKGFSIEDIESWCKDCYMLDLNPLPTIRRIIPYANVEFAYDNGGSVPPNSGEKKGIVYVVVHNPYGEIENVYLALVPPKNN